MGAVASLAQARLAVDPGSTASVEITVRNSGGVVDQFTIDVLGDSSAWAAADPPTLSLFPGAQGTAVVTFSPPRTSATAAGPMPFGVRVESREDPAGSTVSEGTLDVGAFLAPAAELIPRTSHGSGSGRHDIALDNRGNTRIEAALEGLDPDRLVQFAFEPPTISVEPGVAGFAKVLVKPAARFWRGPAKTRPFKVSVQPDAPGAEAVLLDGGFLQTPILPWWFMRALIALIGLVIAAILLWFLVLQPSIKATAADTLIDFGFSPKPGSSAGGGHPGATNAPIPSGSVQVTPQPAGVRSQIDGRLDTTANAVTPAAGTLYLTDLIFSNPTGASGDLTLQRTSPTGTTQLLVLRLENFRDLDFHFVTPIAVHAGETLALVTACAAPVPPAPATACTPAVFYSGYLEGP